MKAYTPEDILLFKNKALQWAASFETACYLDSNTYSDKYSAFDVLIAAGAENVIMSETGSAFEKLEHFSQQTTGWKLGFFGYDLKNETENLSSSNPDYLSFPDLFFFNPLHLIKIKGDEVEIFSPQAIDLISKIEAINFLPDHFSFTGKIDARFTDQEYKTTVQQIKQHIRRGDIYEVNFCQEFFSENCVIDPLAAFKRLNSISPSPFATFFKHKGKYVISATPERFLSRRSSKLISQPIKGTAKRGSNDLEDKNLKEALRSNSKEQSENVMIVDLVRNDLTKCAMPGTVKVEELFGIYTFEQVHQMISTVVCEASPHLSNSEIVKSVFPMGSMTGAPKISAMQIIEKYERTKRGLFSGAIGYISPEGDFDFNVVIRSLLYNEQKKYLSFHVGSAITTASDPDKEYEECLLKAEAIRKTLQGDYKIIRT